MSRAEKRKAPEDDLNYKDLEDAVDEENEEQFAKRSRASIGAEELMDISQESVVSSENSSPRHASRVSFELRRLTDIFSNIGVKDVDIEPRDRPQKPVSANQISAFAESPSPSPGLKAAERLSPVKLVPDKI